MQSFISNTLVRPFHGLHLRRTDLRVGLSDAEVLALVQRHPKEVFFVCSDDPQAEALACAHEEGVVPKAFDSIKVAFAQTQQGQAGFEDVTVGCTRAHGELWIDQGVDVTRLRYLQTKASPTWELRS